MNVSVVLPGALRSHAGDRSQVSVLLPDGSTVRELLDHLDADLPAVGRRIRDEQGGLRRYVNVYLGEEDVRTAGLLDAVLHDGDRVLVLPSVAGG